MVTFQFANCCLPETNHFFNRNHETIQSKIRLDNIFFVAKTTTLRKKTMALQGGAPQVISWFITHENCRYIIYKPTMALEIPVIIR